MVMSVIVGFTGIVLSESLSVRVQLGTFANVICNKTTCSHTTKLILLERLSDMSDFANVTKSVDDFMVFIIVSSSSITWAAAVHCGK